MRTAEDSTRWAPSSATLGIYEHVWRAAPILGGIAAIKEIDILVTSSILESTWDMVYKLRQEAATRPRRIKEKP